MRQRNTVNHSNLLFSLIANTISVTLQTNTPAIYESRPNGQYHSAVQTPKTHYQNRHIKTLKEIHDTCTCTGTIIMSMRIQFESSDSKMHIEEHLHLLQTSSTQKYNLHSLHQIHCKYNKDYTEIMFVNAHW